MVEYLLEKETITGAEMVAIIQGRDPATADSPLLAPGPETPAGAEGSPEVPSVPAPQLGGRRPGGGTASRPRGDTEGVTRPGHPSKEQAPPGNDTRAGLF